MKKFFTCLGVATAMLIIANTASAMSATAPFNGTNVIGDLVQPAAHAPTAIEVTMQAIGDSHGITKLEVQAVADSRVSGVVSESNDMVLIALVAEAVLPDANLTLFEGASTPTARSMISENFARSLAANVAVG